MFKVNQPFSLNLKDLNLKDEKTERKGFRSF